MELGAGSGMGKEFYDEFSFIRDLYDEASRTLDYDMAELCFKKHTFGKMMSISADLNKTIYTQPSVLTTSYAAYLVFKEKCREEEIEPEFFLYAGHSLGEYTAILVAGAFDFQTILKIVEKRATFMTESGKAYPGAGLMAVLDKGQEIDYDKMCTICKDFGVYITLNNTKSQIVVGGSKKRLGELSKELKKEGKLGKILKVEGPFHTPIMRPAAEKLKRELNQYDIQIAGKPILANVSSDAIVDPKHIRQELYEQIFKVVDWRGCIEKIVANGGDLFIEVGPKRVLSNMIKDINAAVPSLNVEDMASLEKTVTELKSL